MGQLKSIVVIYHDHCQDGFGAAFSAYKKFGNSASYLPCKNRQIPPPLLQDKEVYILDFCYPKEALLDLESKNKKVVVIDHHFSVKEVAESLKEHIFTTEHAASYLAWEYFVGTPIPTLIKILEIIDLAKDKDNEYVDLITYILSKPYTFETYEQLLKDFEDQPTMIKIKELGKSQNDYLKVIVHSLTEDPDFVVFEGYTVPCINIFLPINEKSIVLTELYTRYPPFAMSYRFDEGFIKVSLRGDGTVDLSALAGKYGGGGHKGSSGFIVPSNLTLPFVQTLKNNQSRTVLQN